MEQNANRSKNISTSKLFESMKRIEIYDRDRYRKMDDMRQKLKQLKTVY